MVETSVNGSSVLGRTPLDREPIGEQESTLNPDSGVTLGEMGRTMLRVERKLDTAIEDMDRKLSLAIAAMETKVGASQTDHEKRLRILERWMWGAIGTSVAGIGTAITALVTAIQNG